MTEGLPSATQKPRLDELLTTMGITREQLKEMTADDLFAAATQWQDTVTIATEPQPTAPADRLPDNVQERSVGISSMS